MADLLSRGLARHWSTMIALFCGSRNWRDKGPIWEAMNNCLHRGVRIIVEGGARGADRMAKQVAAEDFGLHVATVNAQWERYGRGAGMLRNKAMLELKPDVVFAFPLGNSPGTRMMIELAKEQGIEVIVYHDV